MVCQLDADNEAAQQAGATQPGDPKGRKPPSAQKVARPKSTTKKDPRKDKGAEETPVPHRKGMLLQLPPRELNLLQNQLTYASPKPIDPDLLQIAATFGYRLERVEKQIVFGQPQNDQKEEEEQPPAQSDTELFLQRVAQHERDCADLALNTLRRIVKESQDYNEK